MDRVALAVLAWIAGPAFAGQPPTDGPGGATPPQSGGVLAGPKVAEAEERKATLVESDYEGKVKRPEVAPEEAAIKLLDLSDAERAAVDAVLAERTRLMDAFITDHLDLLTRLGSASESGNKAAQFRAVVEAFAATEPIRAKGPLARQVRAALEPANQERFDALMKEYWDAVVAERQQAAKKAGKREGRLGIITDERFKAFGREIERAFGRIVGGGAEREFDEFIAALELRPDQERPIRRMAEELAIRTKFKPTQAQERDFILKVASMLDQKQRRLLAERIAAEECGRGGMKDMKGR